MTRVALAVVLVLGCGCRRKHVDTGYESDTPPAVAADHAPAPEEASGASGASGTTAPNPLGEPVLPPRAAAKLPDGGTLNNDPRGPRPAEWKAITDAAMPAMQACFDAAALPNGEIPVTVHYTVELRGEPGAVSAKGSAPQVTLDCCARVVEGLRFPPYGGPKVERDLAFTWFKRAPAVDGGAGAAAAKKP